MGGGGEGCVRTHRTPSAYAPAMYSPISSIIHETTKSAKTFDRTGVRAVGRVSPAHWGCLTFGMDVMLESLHIAGTSPEEREVLKICMTGSASS